MRAELLPGSPAAAAMALGAPRRDLRPVRPASAASMPAAGPPAAERRPPVAHSTSCPAASSAAPTAPSAARGRSPAWRRRGPAPALPRRPPRRPDARRGRRSSAPGGARGAALDSGGDHDRFPSGQASAAPALAADISDVTASDASLRRFLHGLPGVDQVGAEARAADARHPLDQDHGQGLGASTWRSR